MFDVITVDKLKHNNFFSMKDKNFGSWKENEQRFHCIFTVAFDRLELPAGATNWRTATVKIRRNPLLRFHSMIRLMLLTNLLLITSYSIDKLFRINFLVTCLSDPALISKILKTQYIVTWIYRSFMESNKVILAAG